MDCCVVAVTGVTEMSGTETVKKSRRATVSAFVQHILGTVNGADLQRERKECTEVEKLYLMRQDFSLIQNMGSQEDIISTTVSISEG